MFESTNELPGNAFLDHLQCACALLRADTPESESEIPDGGMLSPGGPRKHQKLRSVSGTSVEASAADRESIFVLEKLNIVIRSNAARLSQHDTADSGWDLLMSKLINTLASRSAPSDVRMKAALTFNQMAVLVATVDDSQPSTLQDVVRARSFEALLKEIRSLESTHISDGRISLPTQIEIHVRALDSSRAILEHCGDSLELGWTSVFSIVNSIPLSGSSPNKSGPFQPPRSPKLVHSSFGSLQLICSDFLGSVPSSSLLQLLDTLFTFSDQDQDLNISLTVFAYQSCLVVMSADHS